MRRRLSGAQQVVAADPHSATSLRSFAPRGCVAALLGPSASAEPRRYAPESAHRVISMKSKLIVVITATIILGCSNKPDEIHAPHSGRSLESSPIKILLARDVNYEALNPARGEMSPRAGTLWGNRNKEVPTGFLAQFKNGFSSPPHIHNATYRAVVISGGIHNDDPNAELMWMGPGSFWTQPKGETHITAAQGHTNIALVEIDKGPYLVKPPTAEFDSGERPVNIDASNIVWIPVTEQSSSPKNAEISYLWGKQAAGESRGLFLRFSPAFTGTIRAAGNTFHAVVIEGSLEHDSSDGEVLESGSYFGASAASKHQINASATSGATIYIRTNDRIELSRDR